ncbi:TIGR03089 family protein [Corynebacterium anserum]|uniref:AMP-binding protein n=1 Tax=Corynebacterium anserum TaxID=2684406 RepID=A0A7G7YPQ4_9CORY|nr:TIGR03089 family protein [Corynebacterium anserum]MBC2682114.1 hypothetical protein [Corynebacterium anserum]QNH96474.1 AMP-binding protein [Corynebacterium anserum]
MDLIAPLLSNPAEPRLTTYTDAGRMELSAVTLANWQSKVANLLMSIGIGAGDEVAISATPGWQPAVIAIGCWRVGASIIDAKLSSMPDSPPSTARVLFTDSVAFAEAFEASEAGAQIEEVYVLSDDPFGRGVEECGGDIPFGMNDFSPELRAQPDVFLGPEPQAESNDLPVLGNYAQQLNLNNGQRVLLEMWDGAEGLKKCLSPLSVQGSVVVTTDTTDERLSQLADTEKAHVIPPIR